MFLFYYEMDTFSQLFSHIMLLFKTNDEQTLKFSKND